jgi:hypothetical protein
MRELILEYSTHVRDDNGISYIARTYATERADGTWAAWLEFTPVGSPRITLRTDQESTQPNRAAVEYWASGLEPVYLEGALARALP